MAVFKVNKTKNYTVMSNYHLQEREMSLKAKGLLSMMLSLPESWDYSIDGLVAICKEEESAIKSALRELKQFGYLTIDKKMPNETTTGRIEYVYNIYEQPQQKQGVEKQEVENQPLENHTLLNNKKSNNNNQILIIKDIVAYLNEKAQPDKPYRATNQKTQKHINARLNEGYTLDDFKTVIDKKVDEWKGTEMEKYLRPETLFGSKFESYLNAKINKKQVAKKQAIIGGCEIHRHEYSTEQLNSLFAVLDEEEDDK